MRSLSIIAVSLAFAAPAHAVRHVVTLSGVVGGEAADQRYEFAGDFLQTFYGVPLISGSALPPLERAVAESRTPGSGRTQGFHAPNATTGTPDIDGGSGVKVALTNVGSLNRVAPAPTGEVTTPWIDDQSRAFSLAVVGSTATYTVGANVWSFTAASVIGINAVQFRLRSAGQNQVFLSDVTLTSGGNTRALGCASLGICGVGSTGTFSASAGDVQISLFDRIYGDFTINGKWTFDLEGGRHSNNAQIKLLALPRGLTDTVPEPSSWAMLIAGFGLIGASLRRQRRVTAYA